jgi:cell division septation protein DedD
VPPRRDESSDPARQAVSDPLAELARLIGQDEAFGAIVRNSARAEPRPEPQRQPDPPPSSSWRGRNEPAGWQGRQVQSETHDPYAYEHESARAEQAHPTTAYDPHAYDHGHSAEETDAAVHHAPAEAGHYAHDTGGEYYEGGDGHDAQEGHYEGEEEYADPVPERRRGAIVMVAAVAGLALVGTAGAFGYWAWSTGPRGEPPLIKADTSPSKVVPATQGESGGSKSVYDRYADKGATSERMVSREEAPAEIKTAPSRSVFPSVGGVYGPAPTQPAVVAPPASGVSANGEPRKVHTEVIRPGPNQVAAADIGQPVAPPLTVASTPPSPPPAPPAPAKQPAPRTKQAAQTPAAQPTDAAPAAPASGGFVVQLSSQKTEEEARASFKVLATKYAAVFGDREPYIKRVTIPDKGTFYRANVGPFATQSEAAHFCSNLKIVGGQCIVQKN